MAGGAEKAVLADGRKIADLDLLDTIAIYVVANCGMFAEYKVPRSPYSRSRIYVGRHVYLGTKHS